MKRASYLWLPIQEEVRADVGVQIMINEKTDFGMISPTVKKMVGRFGVATLKTSSLPSSLRQWVKQNALQGNQQEQILIVKEEDQTPPVRSVFESFGLTSRESEVFSWILKGKTNFETGLILDLSPRTVQKHLENIYNKMGVNSRTEAMARIYQFHSDHD